MQFSLFYDYYAIVNACSFLKKYNALFHAFDMIYNCPDFPALGRKGYPRSAYLKANCISIWLFSVNSFV